MERFKTLTKYKVMCVVLLLLSTYVFVYSVIISSMSTPTSDPRYPYQGWVLQTLRKADRKKLTYNNSLINEDGLVDEIQKIMPNLPMTFWYTNKDKHMEFNSTCAKFPNVLDLEYNNKYWQVFRALPNTTFYLYAAYYDNRKLNKLKPTVRILSVMNQRQSQAKSYCQLWFDGYTKPVFAPTVEYKFVWFTDWGFTLPGTFEPYLVACTIPKERANSVPLSVSLVQKPCDTALNHLKVIYNKPLKKKDFAVCVKGLDFLNADLAVRLVEWIELIHLLGGHKIYFYELDVHPDVKKVLNYYQDKGKIEVTPLTLGGVLPNVHLLQHFFLKKRINHKRENELIPYNDCLYRHMYEYKYITLLDIDEIIMPLSHGNWTDMIHDALLEAKKTMKNKPNFLYVQNTFFLDSMLQKHKLFSGVPSYMHMLQHVYRTKSHNKPRDYSKAFFDTKETISVHNHHPISCFGDCRGYNIKPMTGQLNHYRATCDSATEKECNTMLRDTVADLSIRKYQNTLVSLVTDAIKEMQLI